MSRRNLTRQKEDVYVNVMYIKNEYVFLFLNCNSYAYNAISYTHTGFFQDFVEIVLCLIGYILIYSI